MDEIALTNLFIMLIELQTFEQDSKHFVHLLNVGFQILFLVNQIEYIDRGCLCQVLDVYRYLIKLGSVPIYLC